MKTETKTKSFNKGKVNDKLKIKQGNIYLIDFGEYRNHVKGGIRPGVVLSTTCENSKASQILVAPVTSVKHKHTVKRYRNDVLVCPSKFNGLHSKSVIHAGNIQSVDKDNFCHRIGTLETDKQEDMIKGLMYTIGLSY